jgi:hypothetical protein
LIGGAGFAAIGAGFPTVGAGLATIAAAGALFGAGGWFALQPQRPRVSNESQINRKKAKLGGASDICRD